MIVQHPPKRRPVAALFGTAVLFLLLGFGNLLYGQFKLDSYRQLFQEEVSAESPIPIEDDNMDEGAPEEAKKFRLFLEIEENDLAKQRTHDRRKKIEARLEYYRLVVIGGKSFLAVSGALFLLFLLALRLGTPFVAQE